MGTVFVLDFQLDRKFERGDTWREAVTRAQRVLNNGYFTNSLIGTESVSAGLTRKPPLHPSLPPQPLLISLTSPPPDAPAKSQPRCLRAGPIVKLPLVICPLINEPTSSAASYDSAFLNLRRLIPMMQLCEKHFRELLGVLFVQYEGKYYLFLLH